MQYGEEAADVLQGDGGLYKKLRLPYDPLGCGVLADWAAGCRHRKGLGDHSAHVH